MAREQLILTGPAGEPVDDPDEAVRAEIVAADGTSTLLLRDPIPPAEPPFAVAGPTGDGPPAAP